MKCRALAICGEREGHWVARARSLREFQTSFPDEASCAAFLFERRWPQGFVCPACGEGRAAFLRSRAHTYECLDCGRQRCLIPTASRWNFGLVDLHHALPFRADNRFFDPGKSAKILIAGAVEVIDRGTNQAKPRRKRAKYLDTRSGRIRLAAIPDNSAASIEAFVRANVKTGTTLLTDGHRSYPGLTDYRHDPRTVGKMAGHIVLPWIHRVFALMKRWALGTYHGLRR